MNARRFTPYATRTQTIHLVPARRVAEETGDYQQVNAGKTSMRGGAKRIELEAARRTADVQIGRLLRLANLLDELDTEHLEAERGEVANGIRDAATLLEQHLHSLADAVESNDDAS